MMATCGRGYASWRSSAGGSAIGDCLSCSARDGITINRKKTPRLYREEGLTVRRRKGRKRAVGARAPAPVLALPNQRWSLDFVHDQLVTGPSFQGAQHRR